MYNVSLQPLQCLTRDNHTIPLCDAGSAPRVEAHSVKPTMSLSTYLYSKPSQLITNVKKKKKKSLLGEGNGNPLPYFHLGNTMDRTAWKATVHELAKELDMT